MSHVGSFSSAGVPEIPSGVISRRLAKTKGVQLLTEPPMLESASKTTPQQKVAKRASQLFSQASKGAIDLLSDIYLSAVILKTQKKNFLPIDRDEKTKSYYYVRIETLEKELGLSREEIEKIKTDHFKGHAHVGERGEIATIRALELAVMQKELTKKLESKDNKKELIRLFVEAMSEGYDLPKLLPRANLSKYTDSQRQLIASCYLIAQVAHAVVAMDVSKIDTALNAALPNSSIHPDLRAILAKLDGEVKEGYKSFLKMSLEKAIRNNSDSTIIELCMKIDLTKGTIDRKNTTQFEAIKKAFDYSIAVALMAGKREQADSLTAIAENLNILP